MFYYIDGGSYEEQTLRRNISDFQVLSIRQAVMRDVSEIDLSGQVLGETHAMPLALAPIGMGGMMARRAEVQVKRAAHATGVPFCLSTVSICPMEEVAAVSGVPFWFQLYMLRDRGIVKELLDRAWGLARARWYSPSIWHCWARVIVTPATASRAAPAPWGGCGRVCCLFSVTRPG